MNYIVVKCSCRQLNFTIFWRQINEKTKCTLSAETQALLYRYFAAAANLYGVIRVCNLLKIYNSQNVMNTSVRLYVLSAHTPKEVFG